MTPVIVSWVVSWVMLSVLVYGVAEFSQRYLYDGTVEGLAWRVIAGCAVLAALLAAMPQTIDAFISLPHYAVLHAVAWTLVFWLLFRYLFRHALAMALLTFLLIGLMVSLAADRLAGRQGSSPLTTPTGPASKLLPKDMPRRPAQKASPPAKTK